MNTLIIYAKRPLPGYAKTRLGRAIGAEQAAGVYARLLYNYLDDLARAGWDDIAIEIATASPEDVPFFAEAFPEWRVTPQIAGDLGQRMDTSFARAFAAGARAAVLTGSDIPGLDAACVREAFAALETAPLVLGPAADGGYYLIGQRAPGAALFGGIAWSTSDVLAQTVALARAQGLAPHTLSRLTDLDTGDDYVAWRQSCVTQNRHKKGTS